MSEKPRKTDPMFWVVMGAIMLVLVVLYALPQVALFMFGAVGGVVVVLWVVAHLRGRRRWYR